MKYLILIITLVVGSFANAQTYKTTYKNSNGYTIGTSTTKVKQPLKVNTRAYGSSAPSGQSVRNATTNALSDWNRGGGGYTLKTYYYKGGYYTAKRIQNMKKRERRKLKRKRRN